MSTVSSKTPLWHILLNPTPDECCPICWRPITNKGAQIPTKSKETVCDRKQRKSVGVCDRKKLHKYFLCGPLKSKRCFHFDFRNIFLKDGVCFVILTLKAWPSDNDAMKAWMNELHGARFDQAINVYQRSQYFINSSRGVDIMVIKYVRRVTLFIGWS